MDLTKKDLTKEEILQATRSSDVWKWIKQHQEEDLTEVAAYFNKLAREESRREHPDFEPGDYIDLRPLY